MPTRLPIFPKNLVTRIFMMNHGRWNQPSWGTREPRSCWWFRNSLRENQLRLVVFPHYLQGFWYPSQVVVAGFLNHQQYLKVIFLDYDHWEFCWLVTPFGWLKTWPFQRMLVTSNEKILKGHGLNHLVFKFWILDDPEPKRQSCFLIPSLKLT